MQRIVVTTETAYMIYWLAEDDLYLSNVELAGTKRPVARSFCLPRWRRAHGSEEH